MSLLSVDDIRPKAAIGGAGAKEARERDIAWLLARKSGFARVRCPACGGGKFSAQIEKYGFAFGRCSECGTLYMPARPPADMLAEFYAASAVMEHFSKHVFPASREARIKHIYTPRLERMREYKEKFINSYSYGVCGGALCGNRSWFGPVRAFGAGERDLRPGYGGGAVGVFGR